MLEAYDILVILGPTASGKTALAVDLAQFLGAEILSADSRQVYRNMDIGTGKDLMEYQNIAYHLIDICNAGEKYNVARYQKDFWSAYHTVREKNKPVILCGGTGMYIEAVLRNFSNFQVAENQTLRSELLLRSYEELFAMAQNLNLDTTMDLSTHKRCIRAIEVAAHTAHTPLQAVSTPVLKPFIIGLNPPVETRRHNIALRLRERLEYGLIDEVQNLVSRGLPLDTLKYYGLEYKFVTEYLEGLYSRKDLEEKLGIAIQQYAKRQMTFFRSMERKGLKIHWIEF